MAAETCLLVKELGAAVGAAVRRELGGL